MLKRLTIGVLAGSIMVAGTGEAMAAEARVDRVDTTAISSINQNVQESTAYTAVTVLGDKVQFSVNGLQHYFSRYTVIEWVNESGKILAVAYPTDNLNRQTGATEHYAKAERNLSEVGEMMPSGTFVTAYAELNGERWPIQAYYIEY
ncbi:hypothetical protein ACTFRP_18620 [Bacillus cereus group sp. MYBK234-1]|uniref:hypothetical protein n=1 Tax=unclassified Bacillus cereus group TaxID=2750818 RepID=UPI003F796017